jgi:ribosomal protein S18 acetylase RimI-like enzyme
MVVKSGKELEYSRDLIPGKKDILELYSDAGWLAYTNDPDCLMKGINGSYGIYTAWTGMELAGLARIIGDGFTIIYLQDILVKEKYRRKGVGTKLLRMILDDYSGVRSVILLTDESKVTDAFYRSLGFQPVGDNNCIAYQRIKGD